VICTLAILMGKASAKVSSICTPFISIISLYIGLYPSTLD
jgi:hypothetical protein